MSDHSIESSDGSFEIIVWSDSDLAQDQKERRWLPLVLTNVARCLICNGRGTITLLTNQAPCEDCQGTGWVDSPDPTDILVIYEEAVGREKRRQE